MQNLINLMFQNQSPIMANNINSLLNSAGLADIALEAYQSYQNGKMDEFAQKMYNTNIKFRIFYDKNKDKTLKEILEEQNIILQ